MRLAWLALVACLVPGCLCDPEQGRPVNPLAYPDLTTQQIANERRPSSLKPPAREPGPPRDEAPRQVAAARQEAAQLVARLKAGGVDGREAASVADMRGYRLYRRRNFKQAQAWFEAAVQADPTFEPALFNAARCAALLGRREQAAERLRGLQKLDTPLSRSRLKLTERDPDFASVLDPRAAPR